MAWLNGYGMASLDTVGLSETFDLLTHPHRRYILYHLANESKTVSIDDLAAAIAAWAEGPTEPRRTDDRAAIEAELHHRHLPKLADAGIITIGPNRDVIERSETVGLDELLDETAQIDGYSPVAAGD